METPSGWGRAQGALVSTGRRHRLSTRSLPRREGPRGRGRRSLWERHLGARSRVETTTSASPLGQPRKTRAHLCPAAKVGPSTSPVVQGATGPSTAHSRRRLSWRSRDGRSRSRGLEQTRTVGPVALDREGDGVGRVAARRYAPHRYVEGRAVAGDLVVGGAGQDERGLVRGGDRGGQVGELVPPDAVVEGEAAGDCL